MNVARQCKQPFRTPYSSARPALATAFVLGAMACVTGCRSADIVPTAIVNAPSGGDRSDANLATLPPTQTAQVPHSTTRNVRVLAAQQSYTPQQSFEQYPQQQYPQQQYPQQQYPQQAPAPIERQAPASPYDNQADTYDPGEDSGYEALVDASQPPPPLPEYDQPPVPETNDLWTPGYWNYAPQGYFWVPGAWVAPPYVGALWTPAYWAFDSNRYRLHRGFWARHIGFYGGINYGFGYTGIGYGGGYWNGDTFFYNRAVNRVDITTIHNVYTRNLTVRNDTRISYNGGNGGLNARPGAQELAVLREQRTPPMRTQVQLREASSQNRQQFYSENHGRPAEPFATRPIAAERSTLPLARPLQQQGQRPQPTSQAFDQQRLNQQQQDQQRSQRVQGMQNQPQNSPQNQLLQPLQTRSQQGEQRFDARAPRQEQAAPAQAAPAQSAPAQSPQQQATPQQQRPLQQRNQQTDQQRFQQPPRTYQQPQNNQQQQFDQQRMQQQRNNQQQQDERQRAQQQQQQRNTQQQAEQQRNNQPQRAPQQQPRPEQSRPQQPEAQARPQSQHPHGDAPRR